MSAAILPGRNGGRTKICANCPLFDHRHVGWQRAGPHDERQITRAREIKIAGNLACIAGDGFTDHWCRKHLIIENNGEGLSDACLCGLGETVSANTVQSEGNDRLLRGGVDAGLGIDKVLVGYQRLLLYQIGNRRVIKGVNDFVALRRRSVDGLLNRHRRIDHLEAKLSGQAQYVLEQL